MKLLLDIGNTRIKWALADQKQILRNDACNHSELASLLANIGVKIKRVVVASVADKSLAYTIEEWAKAKKIPVKHVSVERNCAGVRVAYNKIENLGVDRWLAMLAAWDLENNACAVIDAGSAITVDYLDASGVHQGGLIVPGKEFLRKSLFSSTDAVKVPSFNMPAHWQPGDDTAPCVQNGVAAMVKGFVLEALEGFGQTRKCILTGGDAESVMALLGKDHGFNIELQPQLVFLGLNCVS